MTAIVLLRRDLRLVDNAALTAACLEHEQVIPLYIREPDHGEWAPGAASRWWLHHSLAALQTEFKTRGGGLNLCRGEMLNLLPELCRRHGVKAVHWNRNYEPDELKRDGLLESILRQRGIQAHNHAGSLWREPSALLNQEDRPYKVFTPFWRRLREQLTVTAPLALPRVRRWMTLPESQPLESLGLMPRIVWYGGLEDTWKPGETGAQQALKDFARLARCPYRATCAHRRASFVPPLA